jgi:hypothetical protein
MGWNVHLTWHKDMADGGAPCLTVTVSREVTAWDRAQLASMNNPVHWESWDFRAVWHARPGAPGSMRQYGRHGGHTPWNLTRRDFTVNTMVGIIRSWPAPDSVAAPPVD